MAFIFNPDNIQPMKTKSSMKPSMKTMKTKLNMKPNLEINFLDEKEMNFLTEFISDIIEIDIDKNFDTKVDNIFKKSAKDINVIESTKNKLDTLIEKYQLSGLQKSLEKISSEKKIYNSIKYITEKKQNSIKHKSNSIKHKSNSIKHKSNSIKHKSNSIKDTQKSIKNMKGGSPADRRISAAIISEIIKFFSSEKNVDSVISAQCFVFIVLIAIIVNSIVASDDPYLIQKKKIFLVAFMKLWYNIVGETIVHIDNPVVEIDLPDDSAREFDYFDHDPRYFWSNKQIYPGENRPIALDVPDDAEDEIMQKIEYFKNVQRERKYKIRYLFNKNNSVIRESIRKLEIELNNLLQPEHVLTNVEYVDRGAVSKTSIFDNKRFSQASIVKAGTRSETDTTIDPHENATAPDEEIDPYENASAPYEDDIVMASVESGNQTKHILLIFIESCLEYLSRNNTITGGTLKTRSNKKRKNRTKKSKRNSRSA
jgi:hypothetical protein